MPKYEDGYYHVDYPDRGWDTLVEVMDGMAISGEVHCKVDDISGVMTRLEDPAKTLTDFYQRVCDRAEANMALTGTVSGAHWNAMRVILKEMGIEVSR